FHRPRLPPARPALPTRELPGPASSGLRGGVLRLSDHGPLHPYEPAPVLPAARGGTRDLGYRRRDRAALRASADRAGDALAGGRARRACDAPGLAYGRSPAARAAPVLAALCRRRAAVARLGRALHLDLGPAGVRDTDPVRR